MAARRHDRTAPEHEMDVPAFGHAPVCPLRPWMWRIASILVLAAAIGVQTIDLNRPFIGRHDWATAHQAQFARNHLRYGLSVTRTMCVYSQYVHTNPQTRKRYPDHPPLLSLVLALSMWAFGVGEFAVRLVPVVGTVLGIGLTMSIARGLYGPSTALLAGLAMVPMPILVYFGHVACHEPLALAFTMLALRGYLGWLMPSRFGMHPRRDAGLFAAGITLAILTGWVGLIYAGIIALHFAVCALTGGSPRQNSHASGSHVLDWRGESPVRLVRAWALVLVPAALGSLATFTHVLWSLDWHFGHLLGLFVYRSGLKESEAAFTTWTWLLRQGSWLWRNYTSVGLALAGLGALRYLHGRWRARRDPTTRSAGSLGLLIIPGLLFVIVFRSGSFVHEYWWLHVTPGVAILVALGAGLLYRLAGRLAKPAAPLAAGLLTAAMAGETTYRQSYYRHIGDVESVAYEACQYIARHTPADAVIFGNRAFWTRRDYYEGPGIFLKPQIAWYLDRMYVTRDTPQEIAEVASMCPYYLFVFFSDDDRAIGEHLVRTYRIREVWPDRSRPRVIVFDLTARPPDVGRPAPDRPGRLRQMPSGSRSGGGEGTVVCFQMRPQAGRHVLPAGLKQLMMVVRSKVARAPQGVEPAPRIGRAAPDFARATVRAAGRDRLRGHVGSFHLPLRSELGSAVRLHEMAGLRLVPSQLRQQVGIDVAAAQGSIQIIDQLLHPAGRDERRPAGRGRRGLAERLVGGLRPGRKRGGNTAGLRSAQAHGTALSPRFTPGLVADGI